MWFMIEATPDAQSIRLPLHDFYISDERDKCFSTGRCGFFRNFGEKLLGTALALPETAPHPLAKGKVW